MLGNVHPKKRSKLSSIQLLAIVKTTCLKMYGILAPFVDDIKKLVRFIVGFHMFIIIFCSRKMGILLMW